MKVLIVDDDPMTCSYLQGVVEDQEHQARTAENGIQGLDVFREFQPDLVFADVRMPKLDGLGMLAEIRNVRPETLVVIITGYDDASYAKDALRLGANNFLRKPLQQQEIVELLAKYSELLTTRLFERDMPGLIVQRSLKLRFENRRDFIPDIVDFLLRQIEGPLTAEELLGLRLGLTELLMNAIEHGNLGITYEEKSAAMEEGDLRALDALYARRLAEPEREARRVTVAFVRETDYAEWVIADEGEGFDFASLPDSEEEDDIIGLHGRGLLLAGYQFDEIEFLGKGNAVRVRKKFRAGA